MYLGLYKKKENTKLNYFSLFFLQYDPVFQHWGFLFGNVSTCHLKGNILFEISLTPMAFRIIREKEREVRSKIMLREAQCVFN